MIFQEAGLPGVYLVRIDPHKDARGHFARTFCREEFARAGLPAKFAQCSLSFNARRGTLRGLHFQHEPHGEGKLVRCTRGAVYDVAVDLRCDSPTFGKWISAELTQENATALYIPPGLAHGFQTLTDDAELYYQMTHPYFAAAADGVRWNDPAFGVVWPIAEPILSERDAGFASFRP